MEKNTIKFIKKVFILSTIIIIIFNIWDNYLNANSILNSNNNLSGNLSDTNNNAKIYKTLVNSDLWRVWVAISTNIWTSFTQINKIPATIYKEIFSVSDLINNENTKDELIWKNMIIIKDYLNVLKTDVKNLLNTNNNNKLAILNAFIDQLEFRYISWIENQKILTDQKNIFINTMTLTTSKIETLKIKIENDFKNSDSSESLKNIDEYLKLKQEYYFANTYAIYIDHFLVQYNFLNNYSKNLAWVLINNKEAIIKDAFVVITDTWWIEALKKFDLIYNEAEFKVKK